MVYVFDEFLIWLSLLLVELVLMLVGRVPAHENLTRWRSVGVTRAIKIDEVGAGAVKRATVSSIFVARVRGKSPLGIKKNYS